MPIYADVCLVYLGGIGEEAKGFLRIVFDFNRSRTNRCEVAKRWRERERQRYGETIDISPRLFYLFGESSVHHVFLGACVWAFQKYR